ncbi:MAG TPA: RNA-binding protein [Nocardioides bacterium]|uniref:NYN domain-containing protein n=1 Tax=uncultured Nocardioides sp. TaxID=198441 RepID=UPI000EC31C3F|nr:NYN domain-containing protein [uncultured Nocardioides sp.]HCB04858.1 RNA-binding protein [Nocardioides sp.]
MELPEVVRSRLVTLVAASLGDVTPLPPALKQVAGFAPARRARLGASAIMTELERDDELRQRVAVQVGTRAGAEATDVAALAWLERSEGWEDAVRRAGERTQRQPGPDQQEREQRLRERAEEAERTLRDQRRVHKEALDALKAEVATLRRTLGETRAKERAAREEADSGRIRAEEAEGRLERELRQARSQVARLTEEAAQERRAARSDRDEITLRARMLLDTLGEAVIGLRRELALPAASGTPGERVEEAHADEARPTSGPPLVEDPARLAQYLALPRPRLIVDGYNVTKTAWPTQSLEAQRGRLLTLLGALTARTGAETTVVFDGSDARAPVAAPRGVKVIFSRADVIADDVIRDLVAAEPVGRVLVVVTDDRELGADVRRAGGVVAGARALAS